MPITSSAKKALRVARVKKASNDQLRKKLKLLLKKPTKNLSDVISLIDKATKKRVIHKNKANRLKSKLMANVKTNLTKKSTVGISPDISIGIPTSRDRRDDKKVVKKTTVKKSSK